MEGLENTFFGDYLLKQRLARGGMSQVYLAYDERSRREVAIKVVNREDCEHADRFRHEIKVLSMLSHEHILPVLDYGEEGQWLYMVTPYVEYGTLRDLLREKGRLTPEEAGKILVQVCEALQFAHDAGIVHRDIKPSNILLYRGEHVYLSDFGLVRGIDEESDLTRTGCLIGTPEYMAPELAEIPACKSSDIYALGIVLYQMLTGKTPFRAATPLAIYWKQVQEQPVHPSLLVSTIPLSIEQVVLCALEKDPQQRFKSSMALARAYAQGLLYARKERGRQRITAPLATAARVATGPLPARVSTIAEEQKMFDMRRLRRFAAANRVVVARPRRSLLSHKVMAGMLALVLLVAIPFSFGYSLYNNAAHTQAVWGASAPFSSSLVNVGSGSGKLSPTSTTTPGARSNNTYQPVVNFHPRSSPPPPTNKHKHGHKHGHGKK